MCPNNKQTSVSQVHSSEMGAGDETAVYQPGNCLSVWHINSMRNQNQQSHHS